MKFWELLSGESLRSFQHAHLASCIPWLPAKKRNYKRHGPIAVLSPRALCLTVARDKTIFVHCFLNAMLLTQGITRKSCENLSGSRWSDSHQDARAHWHGTDGLPRVHYCRMSSDDVLPSSPGEEDEGEGSGNGVCCDSLSASPRGFGQLDGFNEEGNFSVARGADISEKLPPCGWRGFVQGPLQNR